MRLILGIRYYLRATIVLMGRCGFAREVRFLNHDEEVDIQKIDEGINNRFNWKWLGIETDGVLWGRHVHGCSTIVGRSITCFVRWN